MQRLLPVADIGIEQARVDLAVWLVDQPELEAFSTYFPALATKVISQREEFEDVTPGWKDHPTYVNVTEANPLL